jgi:hypothetical protein
MVKRPIRTGGLVAAKIGMIRARVDPELKARAEDVFGQLGLRASDAIRLFLHIGGFDERNTLRLEDA